MLNHMSGTVGVLHRALPGSVMAVGDTTRALSPAQFYGQALHDEALRLDYPRLFTWEADRARCAKYAAVLEQFSTSEWESRLLDQSLPPHLRRSFFTALADLGRAQEVLEDCFCSRANGVASGRQNMLRVLEEAAQEAVNKADLLGRAMDGESAEYEQAIYETLLASRRAQLDLLYESLEYEHARACDEGEIFDRLHDGVLELCAEIERVSIDAGPVKEAFISLLRSVDLVRVPRAFPLVS